MTETVKLQVTADASKVNPELAKVQKDLGQLAASTKRLEDGFGKFGDRLKQAFTVGAITAFMVKINNAADMLNDLSDRLGASASGLQAIQLAATMAGGSAEAAATALGKMSSTIGDAMAGNKQAVQAFDRLGLSVQELSAMKADEAFRKITDAVAGLGNSFERASVQRAIFGKGASELAGLFAAGSAAIDEVNKRLEEQGARLNDLDVKKIGIMNDELAFQSTVVQNLGVKFLSGLTPAIGVATGALSEMFAKLGGASEAGRGFGVVLTAAIKMVEAAAYGLASTFETVREIIAALLGVITGAVSDLLGGFATLADWVGLDWLSGKLKSGQEVMSGISESLTDIATSAARNADIAGAAAIKAATDIVRAGEIYAQAEADYKAKAAAAAAANAGGQGAGSGYQAPDSGKVGKTVDPFAGINAQSNKTLDKAIGQFDPSTDLEAMTAEARYKWREEREAAHQGTMLGLLSAFNDSWLGQILYAGEAQIAAEEYKNVTIGQMVGQFADMAIQQGGRLGKFGKAVAIASTIWNTADAVIKSYNQAGGYPWGIAPAAAMAAAGMVQLAKIKSTNIGSSGSVAAASGGGGSASAGASAAMPTSVAATRSTESDQKKATQIIISGPIVGGRESARVLLDLLQEAIDSDMLFISGNSRQAMEIRGG